MTDPADVPSGESVWTSNGLTIPNICLNNALGEEICLNEFYRSGVYDLVLVDFTTMWCVYCAEAAEGEQDFIDYMGAAGWQIRWISILEENSEHSPPNQADALAWAEAYNLDPAYVLYDSDQVWFDSATGGIIPTPYLAHTSNMLIWEKFWGWVMYDTVAWFEFLDWLPGHLDWCAEQEGAISMFPPDQQLDGGVE